MDLVAAHNGQDESSPGQTSTHDQSRGLGFRFWLAFWAVAITNLAASLDATTLSVALPTISASIGGSETDAFWAGTSYLLACTAVLLLWVSLSDAFGRRLTMLAALTIFVVGSIICGVAESYAVLIAGRTVQGLGGGGIMGLTTVLITDLVPLRDRPRFYALISIIWALGSTTGPIIGGACSVTGQWRWIFWLNLPVAGIGFCGVFLFLQLTQRPGSLAQRLRRIDFVGSGLFIAAITSFLVPVTWGGTQFAWDSWHTLVPLIIGIVGIAAVGAYVQYMTTSPFIPLYIFHNYSTSIVFAGSFVHGLILYALVYYMPEYFQSVKGYSALIAGVAALPQTATVVPAAILVGAVVGQTGRYRWAVWLGWSLSTLGFGLLILLDAHTSVPAWIFLSAVSGLGVGLLFPSITLALQSSVPPADVAMAATLVLFFRSLGQALGVAVGGAILDNRLRVELQRPEVAALLPPGARYTGAAALVFELNDLDPDAPLAVALKGALVRSFRVIWEIMCGFAGVTMLVHLLVKEYDMNQDHVTDQRFVAIHDKPTEMTLSRGGMQGDDEGRGS